MLTLSEMEFNELSGIMDGYSNRLYDYDTNSDEYSNYKYELDNRFCGLNLWQEKSILHAELNLGNVIIDDNILTCIFDNKLHRFNMLNRKANNGEYAYITNSSNRCPFNPKYIGRCFMVHKQATDYELGLVKDFVIVNEEGSEYGWNLYDSQYVVLEEII